MSPLSRRVLALALAASLGAAAPASADPVLAGPALPDELAVLALGPIPAPQSGRTEPIALHRVSTTDGAYRGRIAFPADRLTRENTFGSHTVLRRSGDGRFLTFTGARAPVGQENPDAVNATAVRVAADGSWTDQPLGTGFIAQTATAIGAVTVDGSRTWVGVRDAGKPLATIAPGDSALTQVAGSSGTSWTSVDLVDGSLVMTSQGGVHRLPGALPTTQATTPMPLFLTASQAWDSAFVDTDGVPGVDTAYVTRSALVTKFVLSGGAWVSRGSFSGEYRQVAARAVAGAVEVYLTSQDRKRIVKVVDTAEIGGALRSAGATTLAYAPGKIDFTGLAFAPGTGFPTDTTPHPPAPPALTAPLSSIQTHVGSTASAKIGVFDANTTDVTVTAASSNQTVLPDDKITITGTGSERTVTFAAAAVGSATVTFTVRAEGETVTDTVTVQASGPAPDPTSHYYAGIPDLSAAIDVGDGYFLGVSDEASAIQLFKGGVSDRSLATWTEGFPTTGEIDFEGATRFGDTIVWTGSHGHSRTGTPSPERRLLAFQKISGEGVATNLQWSHSYTRLWEQWRTWDSSNGHGLGANKLKFNTATRANTLPNAPNGWNVEGLTMAPGSQSVAWFGMRAPTITGADGIERALILPVNNIDKLTSSSVNAQFGAPIFLDLGGRSIRDINKNARDEYLITAGPGDTDDSLQNWALYTWDGDPAHDPKFVNELATNGAAIGAWEGIAHVPNPLVAGSKALLVADSGDTGLGKSYGQYVTIGEPGSGPPAVTGITATPKPGTFDVSWDASAGATRYRVSAVTAAGVHAPGSPKMVSGTSTSFVSVSADAEYTVNVRAENAVTRTANPAAPAKVTPLPGPRVPTTTTLAVAGARIVSAPMTLTATVSDPTAPGTVQFYVSTSAIGQPVPVVNGTATYTQNFSEGLVSLRAVFIPANREDFLGSESAAVPTLIDYRVRHPWVELVSITGDRIARTRHSITVKLHGYQKSELTLVRPRFFLHSAFSRTEMTGNVDFDANGVATLSTTALTAGSHRISASLGGVTHVTAGTDEIPITLVPAGSPAPAVVPVKTTTSLIASVSGPGVRNPAQPLTMTARLTDPTQAGTVQFVDPANGSRYGEPVPVVNGVATATAIVFGETLNLAARFEPATDPASTAWAVSPVVPVFRVATTLPFGPTWATTTTLGVTGDRVAGAPLTATATVAPIGGDAFADRDVYGAVELLDGERVVGFAPTRRGVATFDVSALGVGVHALRARYLPSDALRSTGSESAVEPVAVVVKTDVEGGAGGDVPATLALTLGAPAKFEPFVPGVAKEYTAATTANVISTAGDAALTVSEPGHLTNGAFSLASPLRVELGRSAWTGPVSNEAVDIAFKQAIGANDPLRTGTYSKTLTFTLSTTNP